MRLWLLSCLLTGCSHPPKCPTASALLKGSDGPDQEEASIMAKRCRADGWPGGVVDCLRAAPNGGAEEACLHHLPSEQAARLRRAFAPSRDQAAAKQRRAGDAKLAGDLGALQQFALSQEARRELAKLGNIADPAAVATACAHAAEQVARNARCE